VLFFARSPDKRKDDRPNHSALASAGISHCLSGVNRGVSPVADEKANEIWGNHMRGTKLTIACSIAMLLRRTVRTVQRARRPLECSAKQSLHNC